MGINQGSKELAYSGELFICGRCGRYGRYQVFMTYMYLSLFFIPTFRWGKKYFVKTSCCGAVYELEPETGKQLARGASVTITPDRLRLVSPGSSGSGWRPGKRCAGCGYETQEDFEFCPKCGRKF